MVGGFDGGGGMADAADAIPAKSRGGCASSSDGAAVAGGGSLGATAAMCRFCFDLDCNEG